MFDNFERAEKKLNQLLNREHWELCEVQFKPDRMIYIFVVHHEGVLSRFNDDSTRIEKARFHEQVAFIIYSDGTIEFD